MVSLQQWTARAGCDAVPVIADAVPEASETAVLSVVLNVEGSQTRQLVMGPCRDGVWRHVRLLWQRWQQRQQISAVGVGH